MRGARGEYGDGGDGAVKSGERSAASAARALRLLSRSTSSGSEAIATAIGWPELSVQDGRCREDRYVVDVDSRKGESAVVSEVEYGAKLSDEPCDGDPIGASRGFLNLRL